MNFMTHKNKELAETDTRQCLRDYLKNDKKLNSFCFTTFMHLCVFCLFFRHTWMTMSRLSGWLVKGINWKRPTRAFCCRSYYAFGSNLPPPAITTPYISLILSSLFKAGKGCLNKLKGEGGWSKMRTTTKKCGCLLTQQFPFRVGLSACMPPQRNHGQLTAVSQCMACSVFLLPLFSSLKRQRYERVFCNNSILPEVTKKDFLLIGIGHFLKNSLLTNHYIGYFWS